MPVKSTKRTSDAADAAKKKRPRKKAPRRKLQQQAFELQWIEAGSLQANPSNWRTHPRKQQQAMASVLKDIGWAAPVIYNRKTKRLIDGHLRVKTVIEESGPKTQVPVFVGSWTEVQERKILATFDPTTGMATTDQEALADLLASIAIPAEDEGYAAIQKELDALMRSSRPGESPEEPSVHETSQYYTVVVTCTDRRQQNEVAKKLLAEGYACHKNTKT